MQSIVAKLRAVNSQVAATDELVELSAVGNVVQAEYIRLGIPVPEDVAEALHTLNRELASRREDSIKRRLKELSAQETTLETASEKRERIRAEREKLERELNGAPVSA